MSFIESFREKPFSTRSTGFEIFLEIRNRINQQIPTSMIRLGDGEGIIMGYPEISSRADVDRKWKVWIGDSNITDTEVSSLAKTVRTAVSEADILGVSRKKQCDMSYLWENIVTELIDFGLVNENQIITDTAIHRYLQFSLLYRPLLNKIDYLGIISSRNIGEKLKTEFGVKEIKYYPIRGESAFPGDTQERHFPEGYKRMFDSLEVPFKGALFLVGAGVFGKVYCKWIKDRGGIALDIGSIFEPWAKVPSRTKHPCHHLDEYSKNPVIKATDAVDRYNRLCDEFEMDTPRASVNSNYFSYLPKDW